jgi:hypothetical protein
MEQSKYNLLYRRPMVLQMYDAVWVVTVFPRPLEVDRERQLIHRSKPIPILYPACREYCPEPCSVVKSFSKPGRVFNAPLPQDVRRMMTR